MNEFESKVKIVDYRDYTPDVFNEILFHAHLIDEKEYKNKIREIKLKKLNNK